MTFCGVISKHVIESGFQYITTKEINQPNNTAGALASAYLDHALSKIWL
jgi:hypothetical protein